MAETRASCGIARQDEMTRRQKVGAAQRARITELLAAGRYHAAAADPNKMEFEQKILQAQTEISRCTESGKKNLAAKALVTLESELSVTTNAATLRDNRLRRPAIEPNWDGVLNRVLFYLTMGPAKLKKPDVEKLRKLVAAAVGAGARSLAPKTELKVFLYVCREMSDGRAPPRNDRNVPQRAKKRQ